jgi:hypothetical protein
MRDKSSGIVSTEATTSSPPITLVRRIYAMRRITKLMENLIRIDALIIELAEDAAAQKYLKMDRRSTITAINRWKKIIGVA